MWKDGGEVKTSVAGQTDTEHPQHTHLVDEREAGQQLKQLQHRVTHYVIREENMVIWCYEDRLRM